jgi:eukaryotic-like serine/threonine-protein kinase
VDRRRLIELFEQAIDVPQSERAKWLDEQVAGDSDLRAELERLLRADERSADFLERPPTLVAAAIDTLATNAQSLPNFTGWRTLRRLGSGGTGEVWLAERESDFAQLAAIKQLAYPTPGLLLRFRQERQILARLQHPHIARLIDGGVDDSGAPYLAMEYVDGTPIVDFVRDRQLDVRARLALFLRVCSAVQYAHQNLIVHRDLKPSNIFVDIDGNPKLLDFGIAKVLATTDNSAPTQTAARMLTPDYAAPEQFNGDAVTTATDVYSLGVVLYELLAGVRPPRRDATSTTSDDERTLPPSAAVDRTTNHAKAAARMLRGDLDRIVLKALASDPAQRYSSAEAFSADIQRYLDGRPISVRRDSAWYRVRKFAMRNRYAVAAASVVIAVCIAAAAISLHQAQLAGAQAQRATAVRQFLTGVFAQANPDENQGKPITAHQLLEAGERQLTNEVAANPAVGGDVAALLGRLYRDIGDRERGWQLLQTALTENDNPGVPDEVRARVWLSVASAESEDRDAYNDALAHARQALALIQTSAPGDAETIAEAHRIMALSMIHRGENEAAAALLEKSTIDDSKSAKRSEALADEYVLQGVALGNLTRFDNAERSFTIGADMLRALFGESSNRYAYALNETAQMLIAKGDLVRAEKLQRTVWDIHSRTLGADHFNTLTARHNLLALIEQQGHFAQALPQRLALSEQILTSTTATPLQKARQYDTLSVDYRELNRLDEAEAASQKALSMMAASLGERSAQSLVARRHLAQTFVLEDRGHEAEQILRNALSIAMEHGTETSLIACSLRRDIGNALRRQHQATQAVAQLTALTVDACLIGLTETDAWRPLALADLSASQLDAGDATQALATAQQAVAFGRKSLAGNYGLAAPLLAEARAELALEHASAAEPLLRESLALRNTVYVKDDLRTLEVQVALVECLSVLHKSDEVLALTSSIIPTLRASTNPYAIELLHRLPDKTN